MFSKIDFKPKAEKWFKKNKWKNKSKLIDSVLAEHRLEEFPYKPNYLVQKDNVFYFLQFFQKGDWSHAKRLGFAGTGIDYFKYKLLLALQEITGIQVGLVMWTETEDKFVFRQLDQLPKPIIFWKGMACRAHELKQFEIEYKCYRCFIKRPEITHECIHQHKKKKKIREMAMWEINQFADEFIIQTKLF